MNAARKLAILGCLYLVQGLPFGFQSSALQLYLIDRGVSLTGVGFASALALPWMLKILFAPFVESYYSKRWGRRRSWILPMQTGLASTCLAAAFVPADDALFVLLGLVFLMNLFAATMDIAVDGLAIDLLEERELGYGNIAQVVGYKIGMLTGGGLLVWASAYVGWAGLFTAMAAVVASVLLIMFFVREPGRPIRGTSDADDPPTSMGELLRLLLDAMKVPSMAWMLVFVATYKLGESMADSMFKPFLYTTGFDKEAIALWVVTWGMGFSIAGSFFGGLLASRTTIMRAVAITAVLRAVSVGGEWWLSTHVPTQGEVIVVTAAEQLCGGALTTAMFALMMSRVDPRIGATHYTLLATVEVAGKAPGPLLSGLVADTWGLPTMFAAATILSVAFLALLWPMARAASAPGVSAPSG